ncbi:phosphotransferase [Photobacterium leiognathi]|uniref:phosphotransferase n=1 Tax=Photobacterium leiognathi TaxID=553611 RepID=UPI00273A21B2|nr:phosphotransferase [Photobacterium leiognathi]
MKDNERFDPTPLSLLPDAQFLAATPLSGGLTNRCWKLSLYHPSTQSSADYVWRPLTQSAYMFGVNRQHEYQLLQAIAESGIAPKPYSLLPPSSSMNEQVLIVEWLEGKQAADDVSDTQLCQLQAQIHALPLPEHRLEVKQRLSFYWQHIPEQFKSIQLVAIHHYFQAQSLPYYFSDTCCHFDLGRYNIIVPVEHQSIAQSEQPRLTVIDWEHAAAGDPSLDLAMTIIANDLDLERAVTDYCRARLQHDDTFVVNPEHWLEAVNAWQPWCEYLALLWYLVGYQVWGDEEYLYQANRLEQKLASLVN